MILGVMPKYLEAIKTDLDRTTVMAAVDSIQEMLAKIGEPVLSITGATDAILTCVKEIFTHKVIAYNSFQMFDDKYEKGPVHFVVKLHGRCM